MRIHLIAIGTRMPAWIRAGYEEYAARLPKECALRLVEVPAFKCGKNTTTERILRQEGERMLAAIPKGVRTLALDSKGQHWDTSQLAVRLQAWLRGGRDVALLIGGAEGLAPAVKAGAETVWSLSELTFPHALVRIVVAEQIYRAWSMLQNHPYHRA